MLFSMFSTHINHSDYICPLLNSWLQLVHTNFGIDFAKSNVKSHQLGRNSLKSSTEYKNRSETSSRWTVEASRLPEVLSPGSSGSGVLLRRLDMSPRLRCLCLRLYWNSAYSYQCTTNRVIQNVNQTVTSLSRRFIFKILKFINAWAVSVFPSPIEMGQKPNSKIKQTDKPVMESPVLEDNWSNIKMFQYSFFFLLRNADMKVHHKSVIEKLFAFTSHQTWGHGHMTSWLKMARYDWQRRRKTFNK